MHPLMGNLADIETDALLKQMNSLYPKLAFARRTGNAAMINQINMVIAEHQTEYSKRIVKEVQQAKDNPIFKDSLDIG
jgi:hypothetical protein